MGMNRDTSQSVFAIFLKRFFLCGPILKSLSNLLDLPGGSVGKESACNVGDLGSIPGLGQSPRGGYSNPRQYSCLENTHRERRLAVYSPWGRKEACGST